jgi:hypothetical protein
VRKLSGFTKAKIRGSRHRAYMYGSVQFY